MKNKLIVVVLGVIFSFNPITANACSMYKITKNGRTFVGNNEDFLSPNNQFWFEVAGDKEFGVMYMGLLDDFAQGAINEAGLVFDGFAMPELPITNTEGKTEISIGKAIKNIMQNKSTVEEVKSYLETINLGSLSSSMVVFVDKSGTYLIVEGDLLIIGEESEKSFSNFYYSQTQSVEDVTLPWFQAGQEFLKTTKGEATLDYCSNAMKSMKQKSSDLFSTQFSTIYDLTSLKIRVYLYHDFTEYVELDLMLELKKGNHKTMMVDLFPKESLGSKFYYKYNDINNPVLFLQEQINPEAHNEEELIKMEFNETINVLGYEWLEDKNNPEIAIKVFQYGISLMPSDYDLYDSLGEAYLESKDWNNSIKNYAKSLTLNPENENAIKGILKCKENRDESKVDNR
jgi:tetratricopeptide (TPR) repeat protein